jgi:ribosome-associated protein
VNRKTGISKKVAKKKGERALPKPARAKASRGRSRNQTAQRIALWAAQAGLNKKASAIEIIDVTGKVDYADYLVLMTGQNTRNVAAIADAVEEVLSRRGIHSISVEGLPLAEWVLLDFVDVVVHVFQREARALYDLDGLWMDARRLPVSSGRAARAQSSNEV